MSERYRIVPRIRLKHGYSAYGHVWPAEGRIVTATDVGADILQRLDGDSRFDVVPIDAPGEEPAPPEQVPKPAARRRKS